MQARKRTDIQARKRTDVHLILNSHWPINGACCSNAKKKSLGAQAHRSQARERAVKDSCKW
jgi:hypothetical protein